MAAPARVNIAAWKDPAECCESYTKAKTLPVWQGPLWNHAPVAVKWQAVRIGLSLLTFSGTYFGELSPIFRHILNLLIGPPAACQIYGKPPKWACLALQALPKQIA